MPTTEPPAAGSPTEPEPDLHEVSMIRLATDLKTLWLWFEARQVWKRYYLIESS